MVDKLALTERLRAEGRWAEASQFRVAKIKELRARGMVRAAANEEAWRLMAIKYLPPPAPVPPPPRAPARAAVPLAAPGAETDSEDLWSDLPL
jgi:hypothetical protein